MDILFKVNSISIFILLKNFEKNPENIPKKYPMKKWKRIHFKKNNNIVFNVDRKKNHTHTLLRALIKGF